MNLEKLRGNVGWHMQLSPQAIHLDKFGRELPGKNEDWMVMDVSHTEIQLNEALILGRTVKLGRDHVQSFATNPSRSVAGGQQYGLLKLHVQLYIPQNAPIWFQPCVRPGERVPPPPMQIVEQFVDFQYPVKSGIQKRLEETGYQVGWINVSRLASLELDGWEVAIENDRQGRLMSLHIRTSPENMVFVKRRNTGTA
jgi:hypothetical protein